MSHLPMNLIAAVDAKCGIAKGNRMPWHLPREWAHFVRATSTTADPNRRNVVLMGRKCWESLPAEQRPLPGRLNVVLSRTMQPVISDDLIVARELDQVQDILCAEPFKDRVETIWNCGGHDIYALGLGHAQLHKLVLTRLDADFDCDVHFPLVDWTLFERNAEFDPTQIFTEKGVNWSVTSYTRKMPN